ncbi:hypothetical protein [Natronoflexus pectinivorans]|uniref:Adhesin n=1 Tax=Natronoflexus pectinivorans TaxID=682526 RepID=A0A4V2RW59_9BACT|nr:hypothetical protein [Natronoflexus pectinivorans]TCO06954.1 hypothetical protein EV194_11171 [Natronoflexus pectinivorans]
MKTLFLLIFLTISLGLTGQTDAPPRFTQTGEDHFTRNNIKEIEINNRHGHVFFTTWESDSILVRTTTWVNAPIHAAANEVINDIFINQQHTSEKLHYTTRFGSNFFSNFDFGIIYHVFAPKSLRINVNNRFGNVELINFEGDAHINLEYGSLNGEHAKINNGSLYVSNGNIQIMELNHGEITHLNGSLDIQKLGEVQLSSDFSEGSIYHAKNLNIISSTGKVDINKVDKLHAESGFSFITINKLTERGFIDIHEGSVTIRGFDKGFRELTTSSRKADILLNIAAETPYTMHGQVANGTFTHYASEKMRVIIENNVTSFSGNFSQRTPGVSPTIILFGTDCDITISNESAFD